MLARALAGLILALTVLIGGSVLLARRSAAPLGWLTSTEAGCTFPCWRGITPGQTRFLDAIRILQAQPDIRVTDPDGPRGFNNAVVNFLVQTPNGLLRAEVTSDTSENLVLYIYFLPLDANGHGAIRLGDVIAAFGQPGHVMRDTQNGSMVRFDFNGRGFEALNFPWTFYPFSDGTCARHAAVTGLYLGNDPSFQPWDRWNGFDRQFDFWCHIGR